ncbi:ankyrin repeat domain-containing protein [Brachyspira alvinipulli]|uniref:ankyrin repeat domain-containing protein n=1 Tax=Brachyspira alvinipulli TaxID=84379 RepID=UPI000688D647|nr:ankyrin repeat domain-containing protein [Brachyspira alvinipulli]
MVSNRLKAIINIFAVIIIVASVNIIIYSFSMMIFYNRNSLFYTINIIALLLILNSVIFLLKKNYKVFIILFVLILSFSFVFTASNYIKYVSKVKRNKIVKKDKEVHNSLDRALAKDRFFKAAEKGDIERIKELMRYVDINDKDAYGINALMHALIFNNLESAEFLLENGADVNSRDYQYQTPLMYAAQNGNLEIIKLLISKGANINAKDYRDRTALDMARSKGYNDIVNILENAKKYIKK